MKNISDLPNELILQIFVEGSFVVKDLFMLSMTCKPFRFLFQEIEQWLLLKQVAAKRLPVSYKLLRFGGPGPSISNVLMLGNWSAEAATVSRWCDDMRDLLVRDDDAVRWPVWYTPLWQEHLYVGLLLYKRLSLSGYIMERLEQLPGPFHALLRLASIVVSDMLRAQQFLNDPEAESRWIRWYWHSGRAPGDMAPWPRHDHYWRAIEITLFEQGCRPVVSLIHPSAPNHSPRQPNTPLDRIVDLVLFSILDGTRCFRFRLDDLCLASGRAWGGHDFWMTMTALA
jgi:hypothetical protein